MSRARVSNATNDHTIFDKCGKSISSNMGQAHSIQTKLHWYVLGEDWSGCMRRLRKSQGAEACVLNSCGDLPLHLACYTGNAPPDILRALIDAYPNSLRMPNKLGRDPLELATINYHVDHPYRAEVLFLLRWHRPGQSSSYSNPSFENAENDTTPTADGEVLLPADIFSQSPPDHVYMASTVCVACMENPSNIAILPCGHICLCRTCVFSTSVLRCGRCPVGRCEVVGLYRLENTRTDQESATTMRGVEEEPLCCEDVMTTEFRKCDETKGQMIVEIAC